SRPPDSPRSAGSVRRPADACRAWDGSRSRSREAEPPRATAPRRRRTVARMTPSTPRPRGRGVTEPRSSCSGSASPRRLHGSSTCRASIKTPVSSTIARPVAESFVIEGGRPLNGRLRASGNKNGVLPILAACLLTDEPVQLANVPRIRDVETMIELLRHVGAEVEWTGDNDVRVQAQNVGSDVDEELASSIRASFLLAGPLLARNGHANIPPPGGDVIGRRRLDPHIHAFNELGASI